MGADSTSWDLLAPEVWFDLQELSMTMKHLVWSDITQISIGSNSWSQLDTNGATRDEAFTSSDSRLSFMLSMKVVGMSMQGVLSTVLMGSLKFITIIGKEWLEQLI